MDGEEGSGIRLSKRFAGGKVTGTGVAEVDYKTKAGTAWSHNFLNQKPWHPLSYPNQRRKWIAEQTHAQRQCRNEEVAREYAQEQEFFRQTALISKKDREKVEMMKAVSFMYVRPPGYNPESAKAAEIADERKIEGQTSRGAPQDGVSDAMPSESMPGKDLTVEERKKPRPKDVFGRTVPTEEEFEVLKNAPRLETGVPGRVKPFAVEVRNVKCLRCGNYGHQSGDRECPMKDAIMPNEEIRLKRDDPLTAIIAHTDPSEPLKWELKQKPGLSPPRGGFNLDDPNQQIVAEEIFDEYGGFIDGDNIPELLTNFFPDKPRKKKSKKNRKHKKRSSRTSEDDVSSSDFVGREKRLKKNKKNKKWKQTYSNSYSSEDSDLDSYPRNSRHKDLDQSETFKSGNYHRGNGSRPKHLCFSEDDYEKKRDREKETYKSGKRRSKLRYPSEDDYGKKKGGEKDTGKTEKRRSRHSFSSEDDYEKSRKSDRSMTKPSVSAEGSDSSRNYRSKKIRSKHSYSAEDDREKPQRREKSMDKPSVSCEGFDPSGDIRSRKKRSKLSYSSADDSHRHHKSEKRKQKNSYTVDDLESEKQYRSEKRKQRRSCTSDGSDSDSYHIGKKSSHKKFYLSKKFSDRYRRREKVTNEPCHRNSKRKDRRCYSPEDESDGHQISKSNRRNYSHQP